MYMGYSLWYIPVGYFSLYIPLWYIPLWYIPLWYISLGNSPRCIPLWYNPLWHILAGYFSLYISLGNSHRCIPLWYIGVFLFGIIHYGVFFLLGIFL